MNVSVGTFRVTPEMRDRVDQVLDTGRISYGPLCRELERRVAEIHGCRFGILSNSGTSSLHVALQTLKTVYGWKDDAEVLVPSVTFVATLNVVLHCGLKPVVVDVEADLYGMDPDAMQRAITSKTRAVLPVHLFGMPCNMMDIMEISEAEGLRVIEDSCESMFVEHHGHPVGSFGDIACFSMYVAHLITAGIGGISVTNDAVFARLMRSLVNHGRHHIYISIDDDDNLGEARLENVVGNRLRFPEVGHSFRITELEAALALPQLDTRERMLERRRRVAQYYNEHLRKHEALQLPAVRPYTDHAYMMYPVVYLPGPKEPLVLHLERAGIETRDMLPLTDQPAYKDWLDPDDYPVARWINEHGFYIGCHQDITLEQREYVCDTVNSFFTG